MKILRIVDVYEDSYYIAKNDGGLYLFDVNELISHLVKPHKDHFQYKEIFEDDLTPTSNEVEQMKLLLYHCGTTQDIADAFDAFFEKATFVKN